MVYYVFQEELRQKFARILALEQPPDFALLPKARIEKGGRNTDNDGSYVLFRMDGDKPKIVKDLDGRWRRKRKRTDRQYLWDTPEVGGLFHKPTPPSGGKNNPPLA